MSFPHRGGFPETRGLLNFAFSSRNSKNLPGPFPAPPPREYCPEVISILGGENLVLEYLAAIARIRAIAFFSKVVYTTRHELSLYGVSK